MMSSKYRKYIQSDEWKKKKRARKEYDNYTCKHCGLKSELKTEVHHRTYKNLYNEQLDDLITLCWRCHDDFEDKKRGR